MAGNQNSFINMDQFLSGQGSALNLSGTQQQNASPFSLMDPSSSGFLQPFGADQNSGGGLFGQLGNLFKSEGFQSGVSGFSQLANIYSGFKALGLAKDTLSFQKSAFNKNFNAQVKDYENTLKDRWTARNASAASRGQSFESLGSFLNDRKIGG